MQLYSCSALVIECGSILDYSNWKFKCLITSVKHANYRYLWSCSLHSRISFIKSSYNLEKLHLFSLKA